MAASAPAFRPMVKAAGREPVRRGAAAAWQRAPTWRAEAAEHDAILCAAIAGDADTASTLLKAHIEKFLSRNFPSLANPADP